MSSFNDLLLLFLSANWWSESTWTKNSWHPSYSPMYRQYVEEYAHFSLWYCWPCDYTRIKNLPSFFLTSKSGNGTELLKYMDTSVEHYLNFFLNDTSFGRWDTLGFLVNWSLITSVDSEFYLRLCGCPLVIFVENSRKVFSSLHILPFCTVFRFGEIFREKLY